MATQAQFAAGNLSDLSIRQTFEKGAPIKPFGDCLATSATIAPVVQRVSGTLGMCLKAWRPRHDWRKLGPWEAESDSQFGVDMLQEPDSGLSPSDACSTVARGLVTSAAGESADGRSGETQGDSSDDLKKRYRVMACPCRPPWAFDDTFQVAVPPMSVHLTACTTDIHPDSNLAITGRR